MDKHILQVSLDILTIEGVGHPTITLNPRLPADGVAVMA
jgi:hypothetical protein